MSRFDSAGRPIIAAPWDAIADIPERVSELEQLADPGIDRFVGWNTASGSIDYLSTAEALAILGTGSGTELILDKNENNVSVWRRLGSPAGVVTITVTVQPGVIISSFTAAAPALDLSGFASGSTVDLVNEGYIIGKGGDGGEGAGAYEQTGQNDTNYFARGLEGEAGGDAILGPGSGVTFNIDNSAGFIFGGGGGGGGGGAKSTNLASNGGGGGGGAGGSKGGAAGRAVSSSATAGGVGTFGPSGAAGSAGSGAIAGGGSGSAGSGGTGGAFGAAGSAGATPAGSHVLDAPAGAGGTAGKAIELDGGSTGSFTGNTSPNVEGDVS